MYTGALPLASLLMKRESLIVTVAGAPFTSPTSISEAPFKSTLFSNVQLVIEPPALSEKLIAAPDEILLPSPLLLTNTESESSKVAA